MATRRVSEDLPAASLTRRVTILPQIKPAQINSQPRSERRHWLVKKFSKLNSTVRQTYPLPWPVKNLGLPVFSRCAGFIPKTAEL